MILQYLSIEDLSILLLGKIVVEGSTFESSYCWSHASRKQAVTRVYDPRFFVSSQQRFGMTGH